MPGGCLNFNNSCQGVIVALVTGHCNVFTGIAMVRLAMEENTSNAMICAPGSSMDASIVAAPAALKIRFFGCTLESRNPVTDD